MSTTSRRRPALVLCLGTVLGALTWAAWLGWDRAASYDVITGTVQTPYVTLQVLGCALTVGVVTALLAGRRHPAAAAVGVSLGFWVAWTVDAASHDASGLYAVGALLLAIGLATGTTVATAIGVGVRAAMEAAGRRRAADATGRDAAGS